MLNKSDQSGQMQYLVKQLIISNKGTLNKQRNV